MNTIGSSVVSHSSTSDSSLLYYKETTRIAIEMCLLTPHKLLRRHLFCYTCSHQIQTRLISRYEALSSYYPSQVYPTRILQRSRRLPSLRNIQCIARAPSVEGATGSWLNPKPP
jgi:hypothetical protein